MELHPAPAKGIINRPCDAFEPTLYDHYDIEPEIYRDLFAPLLENAVFEYWQDDRADFHLRYFGGPGSGKTTFVAVAAESLRKRYESSRNEVVVSIFTSTRLKWNEDALCGILKSLFIQLCQKGSAKTSRECIALYTSSLRETQRDDSGLGRLEALRAAVNCRINELGTVFLLVDGLDHCRADTAFNDDGETEYPTDLETELAGLGSKVKILSTARAYYKLENDDFMSEWWPSGQVSCDSEVCSSPESIMLESSVYWMCQHQESSTLCWSCYHQAKACKTCNGRANLKQTKNVCINMNRSLESKIPRYIEWELNFQNEQINSRRNVRLGISLAQVNLRAKHTHGIEFPSKVSDMSFGNIAIARLRLELIYFGRGILSVNEGLPPGIVGLLGSVVDSSSEIGVQAVAAVAYLTSKRDEVPVDKVNKVLGLVSEEEGTQILLAAKGLIIAKTNYADGPVLLMFYHLAFKRYATDEYNERINKATKSMIVALEKVKREWEEELR